MSGIGKANITNQYIKTDEHTELIINNSNKGVFKVLISNEDYDKCIKLRWNIQVVKYKDKVKWYAYSSNNGKHMFLHRFILGINGKSVGDHINGETLDNRRENLSECSHKENCRNRGENQNSSGHKGVLWYYYKGYNKWKATIKVDYKTVNLGYYDNIDDAIKARKDAEKKYFGEYIRV